MTQSERVHASAVAYEGRGLLILGASGSGKSSLALQLMAYGADLIADDQTEVTRAQEALVLSAPHSIAGMIEARGLGILNAPATTAELILVIDLDQTETQRLPQNRYRLVLGQKVPCFHKVENAAWPAAILLYLKRCQKYPD